MRQQRNVLALLAVVVISATFHTLVRVELLGAARTVVLPIATSDATLRAPAPLAQAPSSWSTATRGGHLETSGDLRSPVASSSAATAQVPTAAVVTAAAINTSTSTTTPCHYRYRLLLWNIQQASSRRASDRITRAVLSFAAARHFDAIALNEVWHDDSALASLSAPLGYPHVALHRGASGSRLGLLSATPLSVHPVRHTAGHGAICVAPAPRAAAAPGGGTPPVICVAHLSPSGETARLQELPSLLGAVPRWQPALLVGDLNTLSPLDAVATARCDPSGPGTGAGTGTDADAVPAASGSASAVASAASEADAGAALLRELRASRKLRRKFLNASGCAAVRSMRLLMREGLRDLAHLTTPARGAPDPTWRAAPAQHVPTAEEETLARVQPSPPPPPPVRLNQLALSPPPPSAAGGMALRLDYALANEAFLQRCAVEPVAALPSADGSARGWGVRASRIPPSELAEHGVAALSEHAPLEIALGDGLPSGASAATVAAAARAQQAAGAMETAPLRSVSATSPRQPAAAGAGGGGHGKDGGGRPPRVAGARAGALVSPEARLADGGGGGSRLPTDTEVATMPGGLPHAAGDACDTLGAGRAKGLARLHSELDAEASFTRRCQALSGVLGLLGRTQRLATCAVVGGSGLLRTHPQGGTIDAHDAVFRVNNCPVRGFEALVGSHTSVRFLNGPRSLIWAREVAKRKKGAPPPIELLGNDHVVVWGDAMTHDRLRSALPANASVVRANSRFRRECADKTFWSAEELDSHRQSNGVSRLEITFGFEAVSHALYACDRVDLYGFFLDPVDAKRQTNAAEKPMHTPYHYYENATYDKSAKDPWRPWTYKFHNFELEHAKYRQLEAACWLKIGM